MTISTSANEPPTRADLKKIQERIEAQIKHLEKHQSKKQRIQEELKQLENKQSNLNKNINAHRSTVQRLEKKIAALKAKQESLSKQKLQQQTELETLLYSAFRLSRESKIKLFLNQEDPKKITRSLIFANYIHDSHQYKLTQFRETLDKLASVQNDIQKQKKDKQYALTTLDTETKKLKLTLNERAKLLTSVNQIIVSSTEKIQSLKADQERLKKLIEKVEQSIANIQVPSDMRAFAQMKRKLPSPVSQMHNNQFGKKIDDSDLRWQGVSFKAKEGEAVKAVHFGRVVFSGWFRGKGLLLILDHGDGYMTLYAHNQTLLNETGDWVKQGDTIASVGNSGGLNKPQLYFEIRHQGEPLNPKHWLKK